MSSSDPVYQQLEFIFNLPTYNYSDTSYSKIRLFIQAVKSKLKNIKYYHIVISTLIFYIALFS
jgi:hypothetical protein